MTDQQGDYTTTKVPESATVGGLSIMGIIVGIGITLPVFYVGANVAQSVGFQSALFVFCFVALFLGTLCTITSIIGRQTRLSTYMILHFPFGKKGVKVVNLIVALPALGWYAITIEIFGEAISDALLQLLGITIPTVVLIAISSALMTLTTIFGFKIIEKFSNVAVPFLIVFVGYILYFALQGEGNWDMIWSAKGNGSMTTLEAISIITGTSILMPVFMPDFTRFAKKNKDALLGALGLGVGYPLILIAGAAPSILTGEEDIMKVMIGLSLTIPALFILVFSTWTTNVVNLYSAILVFSTLNKKWKFWAIGVVSSIIATVLAVMGFSTYFIDMLTFISLVVPSLASIFILHYYYVGKGNYDVSEIETLPDFNWYALISWVASSVVAIATHNSLFQLTTIPFIDAFLAGLIFYGVMLHWINKSTYS